MRILYLYARRWYDTKMSISRWLYGQALADYPGVDLKVWGVGWPGYDAKFSVTHNIKQNLIQYLTQACDDTQWEPTHLWIYKSEDYKGVPETRLPRLLVFNEAYDTGEVLREIDSVKPTHVVFHHENDYQRWRSIVPESVHLPHAAPSRHECLPMVQRSISCLVTGNLNKTIYPLRKRLSNLIRFSLLPGQIYPHPGYRLTNHVSILDQYQAYQQHLGQARLGLGCSSVMKYNLARFAELTMAGVVPVTDHLDDSVFGRYLSKACIIVAHNSSHLKLIKIIKSELRDEVSLQQRSDLLRKTAKTEFSMQVYAQRLVDYLSD